MRNWDDRTRVASGRKQREEEGPTQPHCTKHVTVMRVPEGHLVNPMMSPRCWSCGSTPHPWLLRLRANRVDPLYLVKRSPSVDVDGAWRPISSLATRWLRASRELHNIGRSAPSRSGHPQAVRAYGWPALSRWREQHRGDRDLHDEGEQRWRRPLAPRERVGFLRWCG